MLRFFKILLLNTFTRLPNFCCLHIKCTHTHTDYCSSSLSSALHFFSVNFPPSKVVNFNVNHLQCITLQSHVHKIRDSPFDFQFSPYIRRIIFHASVCAHKLPVGPFRRTHNIIMLKSGKMQSMENVNASLVSTFGGTTCKIRTELQV